MKKNRNFLIEDRGSILVAAIAFAVIMAIAGSGLLMLTGSSVNREEASMDDDRALAAAETGLRLGLRWIAEVANWNAWETSAVDNQTIETFSIDDMGVNVQVAMQNGRTVVISRATSPAMNYIKEITCAVDKASASSMVLFNGLDNQNGLADLWFDGPVHSNAPIRIADLNNVRFVNGPVTVYNASDAGRNYGTGPSGNNYNFGVSVDGLGETGDQGGLLDSVFRNEFRHSQDSLAAPAGLEGDYDIVNLPATSSFHRPILYFYVDSSDGNKVGKYAYYYNGGAAVQRGEIDNKVLYVPNRVKVLGTVKGRATVVTPLDSCIYPVGDLRYLGFDKDSARFDTYDPTNNYGIGDSNTSYLALVSGGDIHFQIGRAKYVSDTSTGELKDGGPTLFLTASLIAGNPGKGITWDNNASLSDFQYSIRAVGSRVVNRFFNYTQRFGADANNKFRFYFDRRLLHGLSAPGIPSIRRITGGGNNLYLLRTDWRERNLPKS